MRMLIPAATLLLTACAITPPEPIAETAGPAVEADGPVILPHQIAQGEVTVRFLDSVPKAKASLILAEALRAKAALEEYFGGPLGEIEVRISDERPIPYANRGKMYLPAYRIDQVNGDWADNDPMSITHEMTHLAGTGRRPDRMLAEGLAVHANDLLGRPTYPNDGEKLHAATLRMQRELGRTIGLVESEQFRKRGSREARRLAYTQEGSFARYFIDRHGLQAYIALMIEETAYADEPERWRALEAEWRAAIASSVDL